jgi:hypothetical protein
MLLWEEAHAQGQAAGHFFVHVHGRASRQDTFLLLNIKIEILLFFDSCGRAPHAIA